MKSTQEKLESLKTDLQKIETILEETKKRERLEKENIEKDRKRTLLKEKGKADNRKHIKELEKIDRQHRKKLMEEKWQMMKWMTQYIEQNTERWRKEEKIRRIAREEKISAWNRSSRMEKIRKIKEKMVRERNLQDVDGVVSDQVYTGVHTLKMDGEKSDQAELNRLTMCSMLMGKEVTRLI